MPPREVEIRIEYTEVSPATDSPPPPNKYITIRANRNEYVEIIEADTIVGAGNLNIPGVTAHLHNILDHLLLGRSELTLEIMGFIITKTPKSP